MASLYAETHDSDARESPERQLWCAVIHRAAHDAFECASGAGTNVERDRLQDDARAWFERNEEDFRLVCHAAGFDPDYVRNRVLVRIAEASSGNRAQLQKPAIGHVNGHNGKAANGHAAKVNGHANGHKNGHGTNGHKATNGYANGHGAKANGHGANGHKAANGHYGHHGANGGRKPTVVVKKAIKHRHAPGKSASAPRGR
jgi:hypothetical protein